MEMIVLVCFVPLILHVMSDILYNRRDLCKGMIEQPMVLEQLTDVSENLCALKCYHRSHCTSIGYSELSNTCYLNSLKCGSVEGNISAVDVVEDVRYWQIGCVSDGEFGLQSNSYLLFEIRTQWLRGEYQSGDYIAVKYYNITLRFKTTGMDGIILFTENSPSSPTTDDFIGIHMAGGYVTHSFHSNNTLIKATSSQRYNDGLWHLLMTERNETEVVICVDDECVSAISQNAELAAHVNTWCNMGGIPSNLTDKAQENLGITVGFDGCITNITVNGVASEPPTEVYNITKCCLSVC